MNVVHKEGKKKGNNILQRLGKKERKQLAKQWCSTFGLSPIIEAFKNIVYFNIDINDS